MNWKKLSVVLGCLVLIGSFLYRWVGTPELPSFKAIWGNTTQATQAHVPKQQTVRTYTVAPGEWTGWITIPPYSDYRYSTSHDVEVETLDGKRYYLRNGQPRFSGERIPIRDASRRFSPIAGATEEVTITVITEPTY